MSLLPLRNPTPPSPPKKRKRKEMVGHCLGAISMSFYVKVIYNNQYTITYTDSLFDFTIYTSNSMCRDITSVVHTYIYHTM